MFIFKPSELLDEIYEVMEPYIVSSSEYESKVIPFIEEYLDKKKIVYTAERVGDYIFGAYAISWIEEDEPVLLIFNYVNDN